MKIFTTLKVGYTSGIYGCSGEYFNTIIINGEKMTNILFYGLYGTDSRINAALEAKGYHYKPLLNVFGKMLLKNTKFFISEYQAIAKIEKLEGATI